MNWRRLALLAAIALYARVSFSGMQCDAEALYAKEIANIESIRSGILDDVFLVAVFDAYFPLPNRYHIFTSATAKKSVSFNTIFSGLGVSSLYQNCISTGEVSGHLQVGNVEDCDVCKGELGTRDSPVEKITEKAGLSIWRFRSESDPTPPILILGQKQFMIVQDSNPRLLETSLSVYEHLRKALGY